MSTALVLVDIQNDYFPGGKMELEGSQDAAQQAQKLLNYFRNRRLPLVHVQHVSTRPGASFFLADSDGVKIHKDVQPQEGEIVIVKHYPNSFRETGLLSHLQSHSIKLLVIAGMMTHMCIDATVRAATDYGFDCLLAHDACATRRQKFAEHLVSAQDVHAAFLAALNGSYGKVMDTDEIIKELG